MKRAIAFLLMLLPALGAAIDVSAKSAVVIDAASGKVLWAKDADASRFPASTTKIMTALLLLEHCLPGDVVTAPPEIENVKEASMHLKPGEKIRVKDLMYALMLRSANDGCYAVAKHVSGSVSAFAELMNARAKQIGCTHTHFDNPNGLNDPKHTTSAHDLALMAREALKIPEFREVVATYRHRINRSINWQDTWMVNHNKLLVKDHTVDGIKTGYTVPAGHCFVGTSVRNGFRVIAVVMASGHWQQDYEDIVAWTFKNHQLQTMMIPGTSTLTRAVEGGVVNQVALDPRAPVEAVVKKLVPGKELSFSSEPQWKDGIKAPVAKGEPVGTVRFKDNDGYEQVVTMVARDSVRATPSAVAVKAASNASNWVFGMFLGAGALLMRAKSRRMKLHARPTTFSHSDAAEAKAPSKADSWNL